MTQELISLNQRKNHELIFGGIVLLMAILFVPTLVGYMLDGGFYNGTSNWARPLKFELSLGIYFLTLYIFSGYVDEHFLLSKGWHLSVWIASITAILEIVFMFSHSVKEDSSHLNALIPIGEIAHVLLGLGALLMIGVSFQLGYYLIYSKNKAIDANLKLAMILGLMATGVLGTITGVYISIVNTHWIGLVLSDAHGIPFLGWSRVKGDPRVSHMIGLHAMQGIPFIAYFFSKIGIDNRRLIWTIFAIWCLITIYLFIQAIRGIPLFPLS